MAYHYTDSGLDYIYLANGYAVYDTPYGEGVSIQDTDKLNKEIARWLVRMPTPLEGAELRFLRLEMELTQKDLAAIMGEQEQTVRRWEKARTRELSGSADRVLRALTNEYIDGDGSIRRMVDRLAELDQVEPRDCVSFEETDDGWRMTA